MAVKIGSARIDENGTAKNGKAGDQTGKEISTQNWYKNTKGWIVLRCRDAGKREKIAQCMEAACKNAHIGYDQSQRLTLYNESKKYGFDVSKVVKNVETDCSALVRVCCAYAGITLANFTTGNQVKTMTATGKFDKLTDTLHCAKSSNLLRGDVLVTATKGHTVVVLSDGDKAYQEKQQYDLLDRDISFEDTGTDVAQLQTLLIGLGYDCGVWGADGDFGDATLEALKEWQDDHGMIEYGTYGIATIAVQEAIISCADTTDAGRVHIIDRRVNVRAEPGLDGVVTAIVTKDTYGTYERQIDDDRGITWFLAKFPNVRGWVSSVCARLEG